MTGTTSASAFRSSAGSPFAASRVEAPAERPLYAQWPKPKATAEAAEAMLAAIPGISSSSARALLERFGSVAAVVVAGPEQWREVPGVGPDRARALEETLGRVRG